MNHVLKFPGEKMWEISTQIMEVLHNVKNIWGGILMTNFANTVMSVKTNTWNIHT